MAVCLSVCLFIFVCLCKTNATLKYFKNKAILAICKCVVVVVVVVVFFSTTTKLMPCNVPCNATQTHTFRCLLAALLHSFVFTDCFVAVVAAAALVKKKN